MDLSVILRAVFFIASIGLVAGGVGGLGLLLGLHLGRRRGPPLAVQPDYERRLGVLEEEFELTQSEVLRLREEREFLRRLRPETDLPATRHQDAA